MGHQRDPKGDERVRYEEIADPVALSGLLNDLEHEFRSMSWRINRKRLNVSEEPCHSMAFGLVFQPFHGIKTATASCLFPKVNQLLLRLSSLLEFKCTSFTINKNLQCLPHVDKRNQGSSLIVALGDFQGGRLLVETTPNQHFAFDIHNRVLRFNGKTQRHATEAFTGTRFSIVLYNITKENQ